MPYHYLPDQTWLCSAHFSGEPVLTLVKDSTLPKGIISEVKEIWKALDCAKYTLGRSEQQGGQDKIEERVLD